MKINFMNPVYYLLISLSFFGSCIKEGMIPCPTYTSRVKVVVASGNDTEINTIDLYLFRIDGSLVEKIGNVILNEWVGLDYPDEGALSIVAFANSAVYEDVICNDHLNESSIALRASQEFDSKLLYDAPGDVFWGNITVENNPLFSEENEIRIIPIVSKINIKVDRHREYTKQLLHLADLPMPEDFTFVVGTKHISVDFMGATCGTPVYYHGKDVVLNTSGCEVGPFNMFSSELGEEVTIYMYHGKTLIDTITEAVYQTRSTAKLRLTAYNGKLLEVYINYQTGMTVALQNTNWLEGGQFWKDF